MPTLIESALIEQTLQALPGWTGDQERIWRDIQLPEHLDAELRRQVDVDAAAMGHYPEVERVPEGTRFALRTPEVGGVSELDFALAAHISDLAHRLTEQAPETAVLPGVEAVRHDDVESESSGTDDPHELRMQPERVRAPVRY